jgi:hypothetical protein
MEHHHATNLHLNRQIIIIIFLIELLFKKLIHYYTTD